MRRFALTGNPIFPLAPGKDHGAGWPPDPSLGGTILRMLRLPWDLHFHGHDFSETVLIAPLGIAVLFFWPVWLFMRTLHGVPNGLSRVRDHELPAVGMAQPACALRDARRWRSFAAADRRQARPVLAKRARRHASEPGGSLLFGS